MRWTGFVRNCLKTAPSRSSQASPGNAITRPNGPSPDGARESATVQGAEWTGHDAFLTRLTDYRQLQACSRQTERCIGDWAGARDLPLPYVFVPKGSLAGPLSPSDCCPALRETLAASADYKVAYDGPGATVFAPALSGLSIPYVVTIDVGPVGTDHHVRDVIKEEPRQCKNGCDRRSQCYVLRSAEREDQSDARRDCSGDGPSFR